MEAILNTIQEGDKPKLLDEVRRVIRLKHYSIRTEKSYCDWIKRGVCPRIASKQPENLFLFLIC